MTLWRLAAGFFLAMAIASAARQAHVLTTGGALAATLLGTIAVGAGYSWGVLLIAYFVTSSLLSRWHSEEKEARTAGTVQKGSERDAVQVLANGVVFGVAALLGFFEPAVRWEALGAGALAASASDTWATEIGTAVRRQPRALLTWQHVPAGTSGAVTLAGTIAAVLGAAAIAGLVLLVGWSRPVAVGTFVGGIAGSTLDTLIGATLQARRWCPRCEQPTERFVHRCGETTTARGGIGWLRNDAVNLLSCVAGGLLALAFVI